MKFLCVLPSNPDQFVRDLSPAQRVLANIGRAFGNPPVTMTFSWLSPGIEEAYEYIRHVQPRVVDGG